jgi:hypothetical protein
VCTQVEVFRAAKERDVRGVLALLAQGVDPNIPCPQNKYTALIAAVFNQVSSTTMLNISYYYNRFS